MRDQRTWSGPLIVSRELRTTLSDLACERRAWIDRMLMEHGAILFRGYGIDSPTAFHEVASSLCDRLLDYVYRSTPRTRVGARVYTATEYRADATIQMHNENSYQHDWPTRLVFCCTHPASTGGETPLASTAGVTGRLGPELVETFKRRGILYVRNYHEGIDLDWRTTFQTESRAEVDSYCRRYGLEWEWLPDGDLRTRQLCHAVAIHPKTGQELWFNQAHLFHISSLDEEDRAALIELYGEAGVPRNAYFGDGSPIDDCALAHVRSAHAAESVTFDWQQGDVLVIDNMLVLHGRRPFTGRREVLVAMGDPVSDYSQGTTAQTCRRTSSQQVHVSPAERI